MQVRAFERYISLRVTLQQGYLMGCRITTSCIYNVSLKQNDDLNGMIKLMKIYAYVKGTGSECASSCFLVLIAVYI